MIIMDDIYEISHFMNDNCEQCHSQILTVLGYFSITVIS